DLPRAIVIGHSLGGGIAIALAGRHPDRVAGLVLLSSMGTGGALDRGFIDDFLAADRRGAMKSVLKRLFADESLVTRDMVADMLAYRRLDGVTEALDRIALGALSEDSAGKLTERRAALTQPVLILHGAEDEVIAPPASGATLIEGAAHMPHMEAAAACNEAIRNFIAEHDHD
ncbi:MAG: alpha/beta fold hydrolase, partial [Pseudomonadota bacterium]